MGSNAKDDELVEDVSLSSILYNNLKLSNFENALSILKKVENKFYLKHNSLEIVPIISRILQEDFCTYDTEVCIEQMFEYIASVANPKESLLVFLEEMELHRSPKYIRVLLKPLQFLLLQQVSTNAKSYTFAWAFKTLNAQISALPLPSLSNLEGDEKKLLDADSDLQNIVNALESALSFYTLFYEKVVGQQLAWQNKTMPSREYLAYFILKLLHKPLVYLDIYIEEGTIESKLYYICSNLVDLISSLLINPFKLLVLIKGKETCHNNDLENKEQTNEEEEVEIVSQLSLANYFYCLLGQKMWASQLPCVYSHQYLFFSSIPLFFHLLTEKKTYAIHKGLVLLKSLLANLSEKSIDRVCLEIANHQDILKALVTVMTLCKSKECRILALDLLKIWIRKFDLPGRFQLLSMAFSTVSHSGVLGIIIHEVKENIRLSLSDSKSTGSHFTGIKLQHILYLACSLPDGPKTDLLEWSDKIMGALNLLLFICLYDQQNKSDFHAILPKINEQFLKPLENAIRITIGHYKLKLSDLAENKDKKQQKVKVELNIIGHDNVPEMLSEQEISMISQALIWFDTMHSVWARVNKLVSATIHSQSTLNHELKFVSQSN